MRFAKWVFWIAGVYGLLLLTPFYFLEERVGIDQPPEITHPEYYYGFLGVGLAWQVLFLVVGSDPVRYRGVMPAAILEKATFAIAAVVLFARGRIAGPVLGGAAIDALLGVLFVAAYLKTPRGSTMNPPRERTNHG